MGYKIVVNEYSNLPGLNSTKVLVSEYAAIGTKTTKVIVVEDTNIGTAAYNEAKAAAVTATDAAAQAQATLANVVPKSGGSMTGNLSFPVAGQGVLIQNASIGNGNGLFGGTGDGASASLSNIQLKSWYGVGIAPAGSNPTNTNTIWFNARNGNIGTVGDITANKSLVSAAQGTEANSLTRKDYVDSQDALKTDQTYTDSQLALKADTTYTDSELIKKADKTYTDAQLALKTDQTYTDAQLVLKLNLTGGTLTGNLTAPKVLLSSTQGTEVNALTRKDYVDSALDTKASNRSNFASNVGVSRSITGATVPTHAGVWSVNNSTWTPFGYGSLYVTTNRLDELTTTGTGSFIHYIFVSHNNAQLFTGTNVNGTWSGWKAVYDDTHKPSSADVGAFDLTGGTITGSLQILNSSLAAPIILNCKNQVGFQFVFNAALNSRYLGVDTNGVLRFGSNLDHVQNNQVFHEGNKQPNLPTTGEFDSSYAFKQTGISQFYTSANNTTVPNGWAGAGFHVLRNTTAGTTTSDAAMTFFSPNNGQNQLYFKNSAGSASGWGSTHGFTSVMLSKPLGAIDLDTLADTSSHGAYWQDVSVNATLVNNYPLGEAGTLLVLGGPYGCTQEYSTFSSNRKFFRGKTGSGGFLPWREVGAYGQIFNATLNSGWTNYDTGYGPAQYVRNGNIVTLSGMIIKAAGVANIAFTLPAGYRPPYRKIFVVQSSTGTYRADVQADGVVSIDVTTATAITWASLDGIVFYSDR